MLTKEGYLSKKEFIHPDMPFTPISKEYFNRLGNVPGTNSLFNRKNINLQILREVINDKLTEWREFHEEKFKDLPDSYKWPTFKDKVLKISPGAKCEQDQNGLYTARTADGEALSNQFLSPRKAWEDAFARKPIQK